jgi:hypothetical protein
VWIQAQLVTLIFLDKSEVLALVLCRQELLMDNLESVTHGIIFSFQRPETGKN